MEVKIGVAESPRELVVSSALTQDEIEKQVSDALEAQRGVLTLVDDKGRRVVIPVSKIAYVDIAPADVRRVGFSAGN
ncbi:MAG TPA: DUF3107 domain-containing protein [Pseudonocardiaceae bacterium]|nr:DUF3107 domain-containing protein [Pseudonocardiaceae bacterium]